MQSLVRDPLLLCWEQSGRIDKEKEHATNPREAVEGPAVFSVRRRP